MKMGKILVCQGGKLRNKNTQKSRHHTTADWLAVLPGKTLRNSLFFLLHILHQIEMVPSFPKYLDNEKIK